MIYKECMQRYTSGCSLFGSRCLTTCGLIAIQYFVSICAAVEHLKKHLLHCVLWMNVKKLS